MMVINARDSFNKHLKIHHRRCTQSNECAVIISLMDPFEDYKIKTVNTGTI